MVFVGGIIGIWVADGGRTGSWIVFAGLALNQVIRGVDRRRARAR